MLSYEFYKVLHISMAFLMLGMLGASFFTEQPSKKVKIFTGVASLFILVGGMGLLARLGVSHSGGWPGWAMAKVVLWLILAVSAPILSKKVPAPKRGYVFVGLFVVAAAAAGIAITKPF